MNLLDFALAGYYFYYRKDFVDNLESIRRLLNVKSLEGRMKLKSEKLYTNKGKRVYQHMNTANWFHRTEALLPDGAILLAVVIYTDKSHTTNDGRHNFHPIMLKLGNWPLEDFFTEAAVEIIGYKPVVPDKIVHTDHERCARREVNHQCMEFLFQRLKDVGLTGVRMELPDGTSGNCYPIPVAYVCDLMEAADVFLVKIQGKMSPDIGRLIPQSKHICMYLCTVYLCTTSTHL